MADGSYSSIMLPPPANLLCDGCMQNGMTAITLATIYGFSAMVKLLAEKGGNVTIKDDVSEFLAYS